jgi:hypothetical protein
MRKLMLIALTALSLAPAVASAQDNDRDRDDRDYHRRRGGLREVDDRRYDRRKGFWLTAGIGGGSESFDANDGLGWSDDKGGGLAYLKLGGTVSQSLLLGAEFNAWGTEYRYEGYDRGLTSAMFIAQWYPAARGDFWLRGGVGFARDYLDIDGGQRTRENGTALAVGMGYDIRVGRNISITPMLDLQGQRYDSHDERLVNLGVGITFH